MSIENLEGKYQVEVNFVGDGRIYINYWDWCHGNDIVAQYIDGKLLDEHQDRKEISLQDFLEQLKETIKKQDCK